MIYISEKKLVYLCRTFISFAFVLQLNMTRLMCSDLYKTAYDQTVKSIDISTGRADIVDCNLNNITGTSTGIKALITKETDLQDIFENIRPQDRQKFYSRVQQEKRMVVDLVSPIQSDTIYTISQRYTSNNLAQHLIGYLDIEENGLTGIEKAYNDKLKDSGQKVTVSFNVNGYGDIYGDVSTTLSENAGVLSLTIDNSLQKIAESIAKEKILNGSIVIMESRTGKIKAMASTPVYDANNVADYLKADNSPLVNKALQAYQPGSVIKPLWAAALLENGTDKDKIYQCLGYTEVDGHIYHCANHRAHGEVNLEKALVVSCNCYFIDSYIKNKDLMFKQTANRVNFGKSISLCDNYGTTAGIFPTAKNLVNTGRLSQTCFGQGDFMVTPVHIAAYMNIFATGGEYINPQIVQGIYHKELASEIEPLYKFNAKRVISQKTAKTVKEMLIKVVEDGNGSRAMPTKLAAGGKTGTAQTGKIKDNGEEIFAAWFGGFYPAQNPKYTICVMLYDGGESSYSAAPIFKDICDRIYYYEYSHWER